MHGFRLRSEINGWMDEWMDVLRRRNGWMDGRTMNGRMNGWMYEWMDAWMGGWVHATPKRLHPDSLNYCVNNYYLQLNYAS